MEESSTPDKEEEKLQTEVVKRKGERLQSETAGCNHPGRRCGTEQTKKRKGVALGEKESSSFSQQIKLMKECRAREVVNQPCILTVSPAQAIT